MSLVETLVLLLVIAPIITIQALGRTSLLKAALFLPAILAGCTVFILAYALYDLGGWDSLVVAAILTIGIGAAIASLAIGLLAGGLWLRYQRRP